MKNFVYQFILKVFSFLKENAEEQRKMEKEFKEQWEKYSLNYKSDK